MPYLRLRRIVGPLATENVIDARRLGNGRMNVLRHRNIGPVLEINVDGRYNVLNLHKEEAHVIHNGL